MSNSVVWFLQGDKGDRGSRGQPGSVGPVGPMGAKVCKYILYDKYQCQTVLLQGDQKTHLADLSSVMFSFQGEPGIMGLQGKTGPSGRGMPGAKVSRWCANVSCCKCQQHHSCFNFLLLLFVRENLDHRVHLEWLENQGWVSVDPRWVQIRGPFHRSSHETKIKWYVLVCRGTEGCQVLLVHLDWKEMDPRALQWASTSMYYSLITLNLHDVIVFHSAPQGLPGPPGLPGETGSDGVGLPGTKVENSQTWYLNRVKWQNHWKSFIHWVNLLSVGLLLLLYQQQIRR